MAKHFLSVLVLKANAASPAIIWQPFRSLRMCETSKSVQPRTILSHIEFAWDLSFVYVR